MSHHIMTVCLVCLLCMDHLPCQVNLRKDLTFPQIQNDNAHYTKYNNDDRQVQNTKVLLAIRTEYSEKNEMDNFATTDNKLDHQGPPQQQDDHVDKKEVYSNIQGTINSINSNRRIPTNMESKRCKRHATHKHNIKSSSAADEMQLMPKITKQYLQQLFEEYGTSNGTINLPSFQRMLHELGLTSLLSVEPVHQPDVQELQLIRNETCLAETTLLHLIQNEQFETFNANVSQDLSKRDLLHMCPVLLYQLSSSNITLRDGCISKELITHIHHANETFLPHKKQDPLNVWSCAFVSVLSCSILGLLGMCIIPFMESMYYKHIIHFLVALAVGTMTGDALLHLLPHALSGQSETNMIYKGFVCMSGIMFFYITEHILTMIGECRKKNAKKTIKNTKWPVMRKNENLSGTIAISGTSGLSEKVCKSKYSSYPYCYDDMSTDNFNDVWLHKSNNDEYTNHPIEMSVVHSLLENDTDMNHQITPKEQNCHCTLHKWMDENIKSADNVLVNGNGSYTANTISGNKQDCTSISSICDCSCNNCTEFNRQQNINNIDTSRETLAGKRDNEQVTVILHEHESTHHGHSHKHGHVHSPPETLSAVAWMIIMGDGLHNFTDGMAIGAAFAENMAGGLSTSLAVFCHELPHELGDFAILIKAGMSVKSAVYYNLLTGVLSFIGMIFGIVFGQSQDTVQWLFAAAAGLFIYIALVDMMPEISAAHKSINEFILQILGISTGVALMLLIAFYEDKLMNIFPIE